MSSCLTFCKEMLDYYIFKCVLLYINVIIMITCLSWSCSSRCLTSKVLNSFLAFFRSSFSCRHALQHTSHITGTLYNTHHTSQARSTTHITGTLYYMYNSLRITLTLFFFIFFGFVQDTFLKISEF